MLVGEGQAQHWMKLLIGMVPRPGDKPLLLLFYHMIRLRESPGDSLWQFLGLSQSQSIGIKFRLVPRSPVSLCMTIIPGSKLSLKKILVFL